MKVGLKFILLQTHKNKLKLTFDSFHRKKTKSVHKLRALLNVVQLVLLFPVELREERVVMQQVARWALNREVFFQFVLIILLLLLHLSHLLLLLLLLIPSPRFVVSSRKSGKSVDTAAAEKLLLLHRPPPHHLPPLIHLLMISK